jgi:hypothetical protein
MQGSIGVRNAGHSPHIRPITPGSSLAFPIPVGRATLAGSRGPVENEKPRALRCRWQQGLQRGAMPSVEGQGGNLADAG